MKRKPWIGLIVGSLCMLLLLSICFSIQRTFAAEAMDVVIVANKDVKETELTKKDIQTIFLGKKAKWGDKSKIVIVTQGKGKTHVSFLKNLVSKTSAQFANYWKKLVFTGKGKMPKSFKTEKDLLTFVAKTKGAVGYVSSTAAKNLDAKLKAITIKKDK